MSGRLPAAERIGELLWLLEGGEAPGLACARLGLTRAAALRLAGRHKDPRIRRLERLMPEPPRPMPTIDRTRTSAWSYRYA